MDKFKPFVFLLLITSSATSYAYIGPGMAGGIIATVIGVIFSLFLAFFGVLYYPIKRALKNRRSKKNKNDQNENPTEDLESG